VVRDVQAAEVLKANIVDIGTQGLQVSVGVRIHKFIVPVVGKKGSTCKISVLSLGEVNANKKQEAIDS